MPRKRNFKAFNEVGMEKAIRDVQKGMPITTVARKYRLNRTPLMYRCSSKSKKTRIDPETNLTGGKMDTCNMYRNWQAFQLQRMNRTV